MKHFKEGLFTMLGLCTGLVVFGELHRFFNKAMSEKCKGSSEEVKAEEEVTEKTE